MEYLPSESKSGHYKAYQNENGKKYLVLEGLDPNDIHAPGALEQFTHRHYDVIATMYWVLMALTFSYLIVTYIAVPLWMRYGKTTK